MFDVKTSILIIITLISSVIAVVKLCEHFFAFVFNQKEERTLAGVRQIESARGEFALLIHSFQHQIVLLSKRIDELETDRDSLEKENEECAAEVRILTKRVDDCEKRHEENR